MREIGRALPCGAGCASSCPARFSESRRARNLHPTLCGQLLDRHNWSLLPQLEYHSQQLIGKAQVPEYTPCVYSDAEYSACILRVCLYLLVASSYGDHSFLRLPVALLPCRSLARVYAVGPVLQV
eukprot:285532-Pleurochrysis_carterae.AAC.2